MGNNDLTILIRSGDWMLTETGLQRRTHHGDAKTGGQKASWEQWDPVADESHRAVQLIMSAMRTLPLEEVRPLLEELKAYYDGEVWDRQIERDVATLGPEEFQRRLTATPI